MRRALICLALFSSLHSLTLQAQQNEAQSGQPAAPSLEERVKALEEEVAALKAALEAAGTPAAAPATQATASAQGVANAALQTAPGEQPTLGGAAGMAKALNPDVSVIGNFIGAAGHNGVAPVPALSMRESEFGFQAVVDPYARADFFLSADAGGASIEEGYITFPALPGGFLAKVGRMRSNFGKLNPLHSHVLPWIDRPLIVNDLMGGDPGESDAGIKDEGLFISRILPAPRGVFLEASAEVDQGNSGSLFQSSRRSDVSSIFHLRGYGDLNDSTNLEFGTSYARGHNDVNNFGICQGSSLSSGSGGSATGGLAGVGPGSGSSSIFGIACSDARNVFGRGYITQLAGFDGTVRWKPLRRAIYHSFVGRTEWVWSRRQELSATERAFGYYFSGDYQFARRWYAGARFDWAERARAAGEHDSGESLVLTYWPSEFSQIRGQLRRTQYAEGTTANELLFQFQFSIGAHGAHPF